MKKICWLWIGLMCGTSLWGQTTDDQDFNNGARWYIGALYTGGISNDLGFHVHQPNTELGIFVGYRLGKRLALQSGFSFGQSSVTEYRFNSSGGITDFKFESVNIYQAPILLRVDLRSPDRRLVPYLLAGMNFNFIDERNIATPMGVTESNESELFYSPALSLGARYKIKGKVDLHLEIKHSGQGLAGVMGVGFSF